MQEIQCPDQGEPVTEAITEAAAEAERVFLLARFDVNSLLEQNQIEKIHCPCLCELAALWQRLSAAHRAAFLAAARTLAGLL